MVCAYVAHILLIDVNVVLSISGGVFQIEELNMTVEGLEKERDFYFGKLRDVEVLCQEHENDDLPLVKQILDILYATEVSLNNFLRLNIDCCSAQNGQRNASITSVIRERSQMCSRTMRVWWNSSSLWDIWPPPPYRQRLTGLS